MKTRKQKKSFSGHSHEECVNHPSERKWCCDSYKNGKGHTCHMKIRKAHVCKVVVANGLCADCNKRFVSEAHTRTPWVYNWRTGLIYSDDIPVADVNCSSELPLREIASNGKHIVRAVNAHEELVSALKQEHNVLIQIDPAEHDAAGPCPMCDLIAKAEGK